VTSQGGAVCTGQSIQGCGTIFSLAPPASGESTWTESILHAFSGLRDGNCLASTAALMRGSDGALYGTTLGGDYGIGGIFKLSPPTTGAAPWGETLLFNFHFSALQGQYPSGDLVMDSSGSIYGTTQGNTIYKLTP
jgi:hypothetical protein